MVIRIPRTTLGPEPATAQSAQRVVPVQMISNPAAAMIRPGEQAAGLAAQILQENRDRDIEMAVLEVDGKRRRADAAVVDEYLQARGGDAVAGREAALKAIAANSKRARSGVKDRAVLDVWKDQDAALNLAAEGRIDAHYREQRLTYQDDTLRARTGQLVSDGQRSATGDGFDPASGQLSPEAQRNRAAYLDSIRERGELHGWSPEQVEQERRAADTEMFGQVAESLILQGRYGTAMNVLTRYGHRIDVPVRDRLAQTAQQGAANASTDDAAARLAASLAHKPLLDAVADVEAAFAAGNVNVRLRDSAIARLKAADQTRDTEQAQAAKQIEDQAQEFASLNGVQDYESLPAGTRTALERAGSADRMRLWLRNGNQWSTTGTGRRALLEFEADDWRKFGSAEQVLDTFRQHLSDADMPKALEKWKDATGKGDAKTVDAKMRDLILTNTAREAGIIGAGKIDDEQAAELSRFEEAALTRAQQDSKDGKVTPEALKKAARSVAFDGITLPGGRKVPFATATREQQTAGYFTTTRDRQVFNRNLTESTKAQILQAIDAYNDEATRRNATRPPDQQIPLKARTMQQVAEEWDVQDRQRIATNLAQAAQDQDTRSRLAIEQGWQKALRQAGGDAVKARDAVLRWNQNPDQRAYAARYAGLSDADLRTLLEFADAEALRADPKAVRTESPDTPFFNPALRELFGGR